MISPKFSFFASVAGFAVSVLLSLVSSAGLAAGLGNEPEQASGEDQVAPPGLDEELEKGLRLLGQGDLTPAHRADWVERFSAPEVPLIPSQLSRLFLVGGSHNSHIDGAKIAAARKDPDLIPLMFENFLNSKVARSTFDPDIFERLLRGLQSFPLDEVRKRLADADLSFVAHASHERLNFDWVAPLAAGLDAGLSDLDPVQSAAAERTTRRWLDELLRPHNYGLTRLQTDSGDDAFGLFRRLEAQHLAVMIETGSSDEARVGLEVAVQRQLNTVEVQKALTVRLEREPNAELRGLARRLQSPKPPATSLYPVGPLEVVPDGRDWLLSIPLQSSIPPMWIAVAVCLSWPLCWLLLAQFRPRLRRFCFPLAAVGMAALLLLTLELFLAAVGYQPLMEIRPSFNPNRAPPELFAETYLEGEPYIVNLDGNSRRLAFPREKGEDVLRVVTLGESSVHGTHYLAEEAFSAVLEERLNAQGQKKRVEVINAGVGGALSDEIVHYARQSYVLEPDLLIMYFGNNDLADMMRLAEFRAWSPASVATRFALDRIRLVRLISMMLPERALARIVPGGAWLDDGVLGVDESKLLRMLSELNLRVNMERIVQNAQSQGVPIVLALQGQNDDMCGSTNEDDPSFHSGCFQQALRRVAHKVGARTGVPVVDIPQALRAHADARVSEAQGQDGRQDRDGFRPRREGAGFAMFYDTCHPTRLGHRLIAETLLPTVATALRR